MKNFLGIEKKYSRYGQSKVAIIPVPFERTTSYGKGTQTGPEAIIEASHYVEFYDEQLDREAYKEGIHTAAPLKMEGDITEIFDQITERFSASLTDQKFVIGLGGEHAISYPIFRAFHKHFQHLSVLQLDAHSDLRESYENSIFSHACVMRRIHEINPNIVQVGIRSQCLEEAAFIKAHNLKIYYAHFLHENGFKNETIENLTENVFITIDVDYFDPSVMPCTGTPEPGGFFWPETINFLDQVFTSRNVVGFDVVELAPQKDVHHPDFLAAKLIYKLITLKMLTYN